MTFKLMLAFSLIFSIAGFGQSKALTDKDYAQKPHWIQMIEVEGVNFNETVKAYEIYWQHHDMPDEQGDRYIGKGDQNKKKLSKKEIKEGKEAAEMLFQVKKFKHWKIKNEPFVKENGNIMTAEERLQFHNQHQ
jgi:hypothetical protein